MKKKQIRTHFLKWSCLLFCFAWAESPAFAQSEELGSQSQDSHLGLSGRIFSDFYVPTGDFINGQLQQISGSVWLQADPKFSETSSAHLTLTADQIAASTISGRTGFQPGVREAYVQYYKSGLEIRAGKMIIPWGKSDVVNPTDFLSAKNYTFFNPDEEVRRLGGVGVKIAWTPMSGNSPFTFTFVGTPVFPQSVLLLASGQIPSGISGFSTVQNPAATLANTELAFKTAYSGTAWDASVLVYKGFNHLPEFGVTSVTSSGTSVAVSANQIFHQYRALGADASVSLDRWVFRGEAAYVWTENSDGQNPLIQPAHLDAVLGVERPIGDDFRIQVQGLIRYFPYYLSPQQLSHSNPVLEAVYQQVAAVNALIQNYQDSFRPGATFRISYSNDQNRLSAEVFMMGNFLGGGFLFRPQISYDLLTL